MRLEISVDTRDLQEKLFLLAKAARVEPGRVLKQEAKYIAEAVIRLTPPASYAQGRAAVAGDIGKVYTTIAAIKRKAKERTFEGKAQFLAALTRAWRKGDDAEVQRLLTQPIGAPVTVRIRPHSRGSSQIPGYTQQRRVSRPLMPGIVAGQTRFGGTLDPALHTGRRNNRGRVTGSQISQVVTPGELNAYRKKIQSRVGWHSSGWVPLADATGARVPGWIRKQQLGARSGVAVVNFGANPFVRARNFDVKIPGYQRTIQAAIDHRWRITVRKLNAVLAGRATNLGFTRTASR